MKNLHFILLTTFTFILLSCSSSDDSNNNDNGDLPGGGGGLLIQKIENDNPGSWDEGDTFYYENGKLKFLITGNCSGNHYYYEYGDNNKVKTQYNFIDYEFDINTVDTDEIIATSAPLFFIYENERLIQQDGDVGAGIPGQYFSYNNNGLLETIENNDEKLVIYYTDNVISEVIYYWLYGGNISTYTFEFDDKINPLYDMNYHYGIPEIDNCRALDRVLMLWDFNIFKNNVTRMYRDNILVYSATYNYNENDYPVRIITKDHSDGDQTSEYITY